LPSLLNIGALLFLVFFIYSVLGVFLFKSVTTGTTVTKFNNFWNFGLAMITLFRACTGENWWTIMFDMMEGSPFAIYYFLTFILIQSFIMMNLFILIIIQYFENYNLKEDNPLDLFQEKLEQFRTHWGNPEYKTNGEKLNQKYIIQFFSELPPPLGFGPKAKKQAIAKEVMAMQLTGDGFGNVYFNEILFASMRRVFGNKLMKEAAFNFEL
jgi:predicted permease